MSKTWMREVQQDCQLSITSWNLNSDWNNESVDAAEMTGLLINQSQLAQRDDEWNRKKKTWT